MEIKNYIPKDLNILTSLFNYDFHAKDVRRIICIAYEGTASDETYVAYEIHYKNKKEPRYYGAIHHEYIGDDLQKCTEIMKNWTRSAKVDLKEHSYDVNYLFELHKPFGITLLDEYC